MRLSRCPRQLPQTVPREFQADLRSLIEHLSKIPNRAFVLSPVGQGSNPDQIPTYEPIGADAFELTARLIGACESCDRASMRSVVRRSKGTTVLPNGKAGTYAFDDLGSNAGMDYKVYEITGGAIQLYGDY